MLLQLLPNELEQRCDFCGAQRRIPYADLRAGVETGQPPEPSDPNIIALPPCRDCDAREFLNRVASTKRGAEPGGADDIAEHRRAVNAVHARLVAEGHTNEGFREWFANESIETERAEIPWTFTSEPVAVVGRPEPADVAFAEFVVNRRGGA